MARILYTGIVSDIKGSIGGTTFMHNSSGRIAKRRSDQKFSLSSNQYSTAAKFASIVVIWRNLLGSERTAWDAIANANPRYDKWGVQKTLSGFQYFVAANRNLITIGEPIQTYPAVYESPQEVNDYDPTATTTTFNLHWSAPQYWTDYTLLVFASPPTQKRSSTSRILRRLITQYSGLSLTNLDILSNYIAVYPLDWPSLITNSHGFIKLFVMSIGVATGITSQFNAFQLEF
jgi:hypothetical protein